MNDAYDVGSNQRSDSDESVVFASEDVIERANRILSLSVRLVRPRSGVAFLLSDRTRMTFGTRELADMVS